MDVRTAERLEQFYSKVYSALERKYAAVQPAFLADAMNYIAINVEQQGESADIYAIVRQATLAVAWKSVIDEMQSKNVDVSTAIASMNSVPGIGNSLQDAARVNQTLIQKLGKQTIMDIIYPAIQQVAPEWATLLEEARSYVESGQEVEGLLPQGNL